MRIVVTGGAGYIGSLLVKKLRSIHHKVTSLDDLSIGDYKWLREIDSRNLKIGDIRADKDLEEVFENADYVAHLAALPGLVQCDERPDDACSINIYGTHQVLEVAQRMSVKRVVFCSTAAIYGAPTRIPIDEEQPLRPLNLYGVTKFAGEKLMDAYWLNNRLETVCLRFGNVYGEGLYTRWNTVIPKFVKLGLEGKPLTVYGDGSSSRDYVHVEDICQAIELAMTVPGIGGEKFNVGGEPTTISEVARIVSEEIESATGTCPETTYHSPRLGEAKEFQYNIVKIKSLLGFKPAWTIRRGVKQLIQYYRKSFKP